MSEAWFYDPIILILSSVSYVLVGLIVGIVRDRKLKSQFESYHDFMSGCYSLPKFILVILMSACNNPFMVTNSGSFYFNNPIILMVSLTFSHILGVLVALAYFCTIRRLHIGTVHEYLEYRYNISNLMRFTLSSIHILIYCLISAKALMIGGETIAKLVSLDRLSIVILITVISVSYVALGGIKAIAWNSMMQEIISLTGYGFILAISTSSSNSPNFSQSLSKEMRSVSFVSVYSALDFLCLAAHVVTIQTTFHASLHIFNTCACEKSGYLVLICSIIPSIINDILESVMAAALHIGYSYEGGSGAQCTSVLFSGSIDGTFLRKTLTSPWLKGEKPQPWFLHNGMNAFLSLIILSRLVRFVSLQLFAGVSHVCIDLIPILKKYIFHFDSVPLTIFTCQQTVFLLGFLTCIICIFMEGYASWSFEIQNFSFYCYLPLFFGICSVGKLFMKPNKFCVGVACVPTMIICVPLYLKQRYSFSKLYYTIGNCQDRLNKTIITQSWRQQIEFYKFFLYFVFPFLFTMTIIIITMVLSYFLDTRGVVNRALLSPVAYINLKRRWMKKRKQGQVQKYIKSHKETQPHLNKRENARNLSHHFASNLKNICTDTDTDDL